MSSITHQTPRTNIVDSRVIQKILSKEEEAEYLNVKHRNALIISIQVMHVSNQIVMIDIDSSIDI